MTGCDYLDNLKGVGFLTILRSFKTTDYKKEIKNIALAKGHSESEISEYFKEVERIRNALNYQCVYDEKSKALVHMNGDRFGEDKSLKIKNSDLIGEKITKFRDYAYGKMDIETQKERVITDLDYGKILRFLKFIPDRVSGGRLSNLCKNTIGFHNFESDEINADLSGEELELELGKIPRRHRANNSSNLNSYNKKLKFNSENSISTKSNASPIKPTSRTTKLSSQERTRH